MRTQYRIWGSQKLCRANSSSHERLHGRERDQGVTNMVSSACHRVEDQACSTTHKLQRLLPATTEPKTDAGVQVQALLWGSYVREDPDVQQGMHAWMHGCQP